MATDSSKLKHCNRGKFTSNFTECRKPQKISEFQEKLLRKGISLKMFLRHAVDFFQSDFASILDVNENVFWDYCCAVLSHIFELKSMCRKMKLQNNYYNFMIDQTICHFTCLQVKFNTVTY